MLRIVCITAILVPLAATANFWGDEVTPRLRVNYLSQANGKHFTTDFYHIFLPFFVSIKRKLSFIARKHCVNGSELSI